MKKILLLLFLVSSSKSVSSQNWAKTYGNSDFIPTTIVLDNGEILALGLADMGRIPADSIILLRIDKQGNILKSFNWKVKFSRLPLVVQSNDSTLLFLFNTDRGKPVSVIRFSLNLDSLDTKPIFSEPNKSFGVRKIKKLSDGNILIASQISSDTALLLKINSIGKVISSQKFRIFNVSSFGGINDFVEEDNGNITFICAGYQNRANNYLFKIDKNLQVLKIIELNTANITQLYKSTDNGFLVLDKGIFIKLDNNGNVVSMNDLKGLFRNHYISQYIYMNNDKLVLFASEFDSLFTPKRNILFQVNSIDKIDTLCTIRLNDNNKNRRFYNPYGSAIYANNGIILSGSAVDTITNQSLGYVAKTDLNCITSSIKEVYSKNVVKIYPNPMFTQTTIELSSTSSEPKRIKLYDITGKILFQDSFNGSVYQLQKGHFKAGLYFFSITADNQNIGSGKIIIE
jgi:hypothetical protein